MGASDPRRPSPRYVLPETVALVVVALADLLTTSWLLAIGAAYEGNPLMAATMRRWGPWGLISVKAFLIAIPISVAEAARNRHPALVRRLLRVALVLYVLLWAAGFAALNRW